MGKFFTQIEESGWGAYLDESKTNAALYPFGWGNSEDEAIERLRDSILTMEDIAAANGYVKLEPNQAITDKNSLEAALRNCWVDFFIEFPGEGEWEDLMEATIEYLQTNELEAAKCES